MNNQTHNEHVLSVIDRFKAGQTMTLIGELRSLGVGLKELRSNKWQRLSVYSLPFARFIPLYSDDLKINAIGVY